MLALLLALTLTADGPWHLVGPGGGGWIDGAGTARTSGTPGSQ